MLQTKVLLVDDNIDLTSILSLILTAEGFSVAICNTLEEGIFYLKDWKPDVLLLDVNIDGEDGRIFCRKIKLAEADKIKIILMSGDETTLNHHELDGADDYLVKPFESGDLLQKLFMHLAHPVDT